jgi:hypothetical protein
VAPEHHLDRRQKRQSPRLPGVGLNGRAATAATTVGSIRSNEEVFRDRGLPIRQMRCQPNRMQYTAGVGHLEGSFGTPNQPRVVDYFAACMDKARIEKTGGGPLGLGEVAIAELLRR